MERVREFLKNAILIINRPYMRILPGQLAFFSLMSLIPMVALIGSITEYFSLSTDFIKSISSSLPVDFVSLFYTSSINGNGLNFNMIVFFITAFLLASNGMHSVIIAANLIYGYKDEGLIMRRVKAIGMTFVVVGLIFFLLIISVFGDLFFKILVMYAKNRNAAIFFRDCFNFLKVPLSIFLIYFNIKSLYLMAPDNRNSSNLVSRASIFTTTIWIIGTEIYSIYVKHFSNYNLFYGSISNIIILMIWIYFLEYVFVFGMAITASIKE